MNEGMYTRVGEWNQHRMDLTTHAETNERNVTDRHTIHSTSWMDLFFCYIACQSGSQHEEMDVQEEQASQGEIAQLSGGDAGFET